MAKYKVTWEEHSHHEVELTAEELSELVGVPVEELDLEDIDPDLQLPDGLAEYSADAFEGLTREYITVEEV